MRSAEMEVFTALWCCAFICSTHHISLINPGADSSPDHYTHTHTDVHRYTHTHTLHGKARHRSSRRLVEKTSMVLFVKTASTDIVTDRESLSGLLQVTTPVLLTPSNLKWYLSAPEKTRSLPNDWQARQPAGRPRATADPHPPTTTTTLPAFTVPVLSQCITVISVSGLWMLPHPPSVGLWLAFFFFLFFFSKHWIK